MSMRHIHMHISMAIIAVNFFMVLSPFLWLMEASYHTNPSLSTHQKNSDCFSDVFAFCPCFPFFSKDVNIPQKSCNLPGGTIQ